jgi:MFS family permease
VAAVIADVVEQARRQVRGVGAAIMMSLTIAAVGDAVPRERTGSAMGLLGTVSAIGTALGPSLGGLLISAAGWPAVFACMGAAGAAAFVAVYALLPTDHGKGPHQDRFDVVGALLLAAAVAAFALATTMSPASYLNALLLAAAAVAIAVFVAVESASAAPLVELRLIKDRDIGAGLISIGLVSAIMMTTLVVGPFYLADVLRLGPAATGMVMSVGPTVSALVGIPAGRLVDRTGPAFAIFAGLSLLLAGVVAMAFGPPVLAVGGYVGSLVLITAGYALFQAANNTAVMRRAAADQRGVTSAILALARNLGLVTGASAMGALFAIGSGGLPALGLASGGDTGLRVTFVVAALLAGVALAAWGMARRRRRRHHASLP